MTKQPNKIDSRSKLFLSNLDIDANKPLDVLIRVNYILNSEQLKLLDACGLRVSSVSGLIIVGSIRYLDITEIIKLSFVNRLEVSRALFQEVV